MDAGVSNSSGGCAGCVRLEALLAEADKRSEQLEKRIAQLERVIEKLQRGSKRQAAPFSKGPPKANPKKPGRKSGKDYGKPAHRAGPESIDQQYEAPLPDRCPYCGQTHIVEERVATQYQTDIPTQPIHRKFHVAVGRCADCGKRVQGRHHLQTSDALGCCSSQLGPNLQALIVHLTKRTGLSHGKVTELLSHGFHIHLSRGGSCQAMLRAARRCKGEYDKIIEHVKQSPWAVSDETGWRIGGWSAWLHTAVTGQATAYRIDRRRGFEAIQALLGADYQGVMIHDGWASYNRFFEATHQTCLAHLLRRCKELLEAATRGAVIFPRKVKAILSEALAVRGQRDGGDITAAAAARQADVLQAQMVKLVEPVKTHPGNERFAAHLYRQQDHLFTFLGDARIDATNWRAEQAIRPAVVNRKVWGGNRTETGAEAQSILMTVHQTARQRQIKPIAWLSRLLRSPDTTPSLLSPASPTLPA